MPIKAEVSTTQSGEQEQPRIMLLSELLAELVENDAVDEDGNLNPSHDMIVIGIPDTGKAAFNGSHAIKSGKQAGKPSKATFVVAELGSSFAGLPIEYRQGNGDVEGLPLSVKLSVTATPPNRDGKTVDEALNRKVELKAVEEPQKTGTNG